MIVFHMASNGLAKARLQLTLGFVGGSSLSFFLFFILYGELIQ